MSGLSPRADIARVDGDQAVVAPRCRVCHEPLFDLESAANHFGREHPARSFDPIRYAHQSELGPDCRLRWVSSSST